MLAYIRNYREVRHIMPALNLQAAKKPMRKTRLMNPLDAPHPINKADVVLLNASRLGIDVMRPQASRPEPGEEHAVITVSKRGNAGFSNLMSGAIAILLEYCQRRSPPA